ncbi:hypothetical protein BC567DRAFT_247014 [Phyllosticta citribraziliensis]
MTNENQKMPWLTSGLPDGGPRYTPNFAPASYDVAVPYIGTRRHTEQLWPVDPLAAPRPAYNANSYSGALNGKNNMPTTTTTPVSDNRTHRIVPAVPRPASNAVGSASMSVNDGRGSGESRESQGNKGPVNIDRLAQHCAFACQQIEALPGRSSSSSKKRKKKRTGR